MMRKLLCSKRISNWYYEMKIWNSILIDSLKEMLNYNKFNQKIENWWINSLIYKHNMNNNSRNWSNYKESMRPRRI